MIQIDIPVSRVTALVLRIPALSGYVEVGGEVVQIPDAMEAKYHATIAEVASIGDTASKLVETKAAKSAAVNAKREAVIAEGYRHPFGGAIGTRILDQRGPEDVTSWLALKLMAQDLNSADQGDTLLPIRDANNQTFSAKSTAVEAAMSDMGTWRARILAQSWVLKDEIAAAADQASVDAIDINDGWPE